MISVYALCVSVIFGLILFPNFINIFKDHHLGQSIREEGPKAHQKKKGTPTMGGLVIIITIILSYIIVINLSKDNHQFYEVLLLILSLFMFGIIGFIDDYLIIVKKNNNGISPNMKLFLQILFSAITFLIYLKISNKTSINLFNLEIKLGFLYGIFILLLITYSSNAVNLTDGLDGLAGGLLIIAFLSFGLLARQKGNETIYLYCLVTSGALISFLVFNFYPSKIMMGDTGSLSLGASLAVVSVLLDVEVLLFVIGMVFLVETLSVILQVLYYKKTRGKRIFLMAPLHHHFELKGYSEIKTVYIFYLMGLIFGTIGYLIGGYL